MAKKLPKTPESIKQVMRQRIMMAMDACRGKIEHLAKGTEELYTLSGCTEIEALCAGVVVLYQMTTRLPGKDVQRICRQLLGELLNTDGPDGPKPHHGDPEEVD